jgi:anthranilate synthase/aminodeoxychorismate synthase-like glutamine amidotransferase
MLSKILLIDNFDSFTYNILELLRNTNLCEIEVLTSDKFDINDTIQYDGIIFSPGPGLPDDFPLMSSILNDNMGKVPILGICLGHQAICQKYGMNLLNLDKVVHGQSRKIKIISESILFESLPSEFVVGLYHSWIVEQFSKIDSLTVTAISEDNYVMAVEDFENSVFGVQFHPESYITEFGLVILINFVKFCAKL